MLRLFLFVALLIPNSSTVAVALWALDDNTTLSPKLSLVADDFIDGGVGHIATNNPRWTPRNSV